ncbi:hypothetical protein [Nitrososphaera sp.]|uniref:hypothetical protein n=1 Tax=Nitrososphaera sp. TaxID=1971748 RepID=UPI0017FB16D3|nr:hypothetical protein [Nitrososphaera sp.]NWG36361.1 hypothetical protein [Nitrososphaera sp.]
MPEIWLKYGSTDVVLDIRFENLASQVSSSLQAIPDEQAKAALDAVPVTDSMLMLALSSSRASAKAVSAIFENARAKGFASVAVDVPARLAGSLRTNLAALAPDPQAQAISINRIDYHSLAERMSKFQSTVIVSQVAYDPLFGFAGAPSALVRSMLPEKMAEAFSARQSNAPAPGTEGAPLKVALGAVEGLQATSVELVAGASGIAGVHAGTVPEAFSKALAQFKPATEVQVDSVKSAIISASGESGAHTTLSSALNSLWNSVHAVKDGGSAVLLAECREGLGGGALQAYVEGRLAQEQVSNTPYSDGLEHLLYIQELKEKKELALVSTLPHYYATKLGFTTFGGARDALEGMLAKHGRGHKALVVADADITLLKTAA